MRLWSYNKAAELVAGGKVKIISSGEHRIIFSVDDQQVIWKSSGAVYCSCKGEIYCKDRIVCPNCKADVERTLFIFNCFHKKATLMFWCMKQLWKRHPENVLAFRKG